MPWLLVYTCENAYPRQEITAYYTEDAALSAAIELVTPQCITARSEEELVTQNDADQIQFLRLVRAGQFREAIHLWHTIAPQLVQIIEVPFSCPADPRTYTIRPPCYYCGKAFSEHAAPDDKCLFGPTTYRAF